MRKDTCILVEVADGRKYIFGSLAAIFDTLTPQEVGKSLEGLWASHLEFGHPLHTKSGATITKMERIKKHQTRGRSY